MGVVNEHSVFIASPGDTAQDRGLIPTLVDEINSSFAPYGHRLRVLHWQRDARPDAGRPQSLINEQIDEYDIFVALLWKRISVGTAEDYSINKTDDVTIGESAGVLLPETGAISLLIPAGSTGNIVAVEESKTLEVKGRLNPDRIDYVIVGDSANVQIAYTINEIDYVSVAEPSGSGKREVVVGSLSAVIAAGATGNTVAVGENVNVAIFTPGLIEIAKADNLTLGELVQVAVVLVIGAGCAKSYDSLVHSLVIDDVAYHSIEIDDTAYHSVESLRSI